MGMILGVLLLVALGIVIAVFGYAAAARRKEVGKRAQYIADYKFPDELRRRLSDHHPGLMPNQITMILDGLRQYFLACLGARRKAKGAAIATHLGMPSKAVDDAWHEFIVMTRDYTQFCESAFGQYLHHTPKAQMSEPTQEALANTLHQVKRPAFSPAGWAMLGAVPLLFAIDRELGLADGHRYDDAALAALEQKRQLMAASEGGGDSGSSFSWGSGDGGTGGDGGGGSCGGGGGCGGSS